MEPQFKIGDKVQLNSGGPVMTISELTPMGFNGPQAKMVRCIWFDKEEKAQSKEFNMATLSLFN